jgi:ribosomal-protein-alanine N-acetyltransferase
LTQSISINPYATDDYDFIVQLAAVSFSEYAHAPGAQVTRTLREANTSTLIAFAPERAGFAMVRRGEDVAYLQAIAVAETHRGRGIGKALLVAVERLAHHHGAEALELATSQANLSALELFLRRGYSIVSRKSRYYERGQDAVILRKHLSAAPG